VLFILLLPALVLVLLTLVSNAAIGMILLVVGPVYGVALIRLGERIGGAYLIGGRRRSSSRSRRREADGHAGTATRSAPTESLTRAVTVSPT
jgi:hypothetical protein